MQQPNSNPNWQQPPQGWQQQYPPQQSYGQPPIMQQPPTRKSRKLAIGCAISAAIAVFLIFVLFIVVVSTSGNHSSTATAVNTATTNNQNTPATTKQTSFKVGDTANLNDVWKATVSNVKKSQGSDYNTPKAGHVFVLIDITMQNLSGEKRYTSSYDWTLTDSTGQKYNPAYVSGVPASPDGDVPSGSKVGGTLAYEVPTSEKTLTLTLAPSIFDDVSAAWIIKIS